MEASIMRAIATLQLAAAIALLVCGDRQIANAQASNDPRVADLVQAGRIRVGLAAVAPHWAVKDRTTGELRGVGIELARALASRIGVALVPVEYPNPPRVFDGLKDGAWDVGFFGVDSSRATVVDFSPAILQMDATYLVGPASSLKTIVEADKPGIRIAVPRNTVEQFVLAPIVKQAELVPVENFAAGFDLLRSGKVEVFAGLRTMLLPMTTQLPGSRVLEDRFNVTLGAMAVPKGQTSRLAYITEFVEEAKSSGLVQRAIERAGVAGVQVPPSANPRSQ
jgi:polar amino acid transport system substrate-binding protein